MTEERQGFCPRAVTQADLDNWFTYHAPTEDQQAKYILLRDGAKKFAETILFCAPAGPDQTAAIRKIREAVMTANAAIACAPPVVQLPPHLRLGARGHYDKDGNAVIEGFDIMGVGLNADGPGVLKSDEEPEGDEPE